MSEFYIIEAFNYYNTYINRQERFTLLKEHGFSVTGSVHPVDWELFGSILTGELGKSGYGSDLSHYEVKSAAGKGSFEYQYHLNTGRMKLQEDMNIDHIFISYSVNYADVIIRLMTGKELAPYFKKWEPELIANYDGKNRKQRFRKNISYGMVVRQGVIIMQIKDYKLFYPVFDELESDYSS